MKVAALDSPIDERVSQKERLDDAGEASQVHRGLGIAALLCCVGALLMLVLSIFSLDEGLYREPSPGRTHYVIQMAGYACFVNAVVAYRVYPFPLRARIVIHALSHISAFSLFTIGVVVRVYTNNVIPLAPKKYWPNMYSLHSILAIVAMGVYLVQIVATIILKSAGMKLKSCNWISARLHREVGMFLLGSFTMVVTCGIQQNLTSCNCVPNVSQEADLRPWVGFATLGVGCRLRYGAGLLVYAAAFFASFALSNLRPLESDGHRNMLVTTVPVKAKKNSFVGDAVDASIGSQAMKQHA